MSTRNKLYKLEITQPEASLLRIALDHFWGTMEENEECGPVWSVINNHYKQLSESLSTIESIEL